MPPQMVKGFCVIYLASRHGDAAFDVKVSSAPTLDGAIRAARARVENLAFAGYGVGQAPVGFVIEDSEGYELHRWYSAAGA